jgi:hypothetical protein
MVPEMWWTLLVTMLALTLLTATFSVLTYRLEELRDGLAS